MLKIVITSRYGDVIYFLFITHIYLTKNNWCCNRIIKYVAAKLEIQTLKIFELQLIDINYYWKLITNIGNILFQ